MASFFEKLKKGMGVESAPKEKKVKTKKVKKITAEIKSVKSEMKKISKIKEDLPKTKEMPLITPPLIKKVELSQDETPSKTKKAPEKKEIWPGQEGELAVDVYQTDSDLVIQSAISGVMSSDLDISIEGDVVTIKGRREKPSEEKGDYFFQECYWGQFGRQIILPVEVDPNRIEADLKEGILTIKIPKIQRERKRKVLVKE